MIYVVLALVVLNIALTLGLYGAKPTEVEIKWINEDVEPEGTFLQMISDEPKSEPQQDPIGNENSVQGPWRNQKNIDPWAPNSSAGGALVPQPPGPLERPGGFAS